MKRKRYKVLFIISFVIFIFSLGALVWYLGLVKTEEKAFKEPRKLVPESGEPRGKEEGLGYYLIDGVIVQEGLKNLYLENNDTIGWISIENTPIDYPVMQTSSDEQYYIHRGFDKEYSFAGCIFASSGSDIVKPSDNIILYGHHMISKSMFTPLDGYKEEDFLKKHKYITFNTLRQTGTYEVIAAFPTQIYASEEDGFMYYSHTYMDEKEFGYYIDSCKELTPYNIEPTAVYGDELITLSTCAYHTSNGRFVVVAKRIDGKEVDLDKKPIEVIETK